MEQYPPQPRVLPTTPVKYKIQNDKNTQTENFNLCDDISNFFTAISTNIDNFINPKPISKSNYKSSKPTNAPKSANAENLCESVDKFFNDFTKNANDFLGNIDKVFNFNNQPNTRSNQFQGR